MLLALTNSPQFRYTLRSELLGTQRLQQYPVDWESIGITLARDRKSHGTTDRVLGPGALCKGRQRLPAPAYQAAGIEADVRVASSSSTPTPSPGSPTTRPRQLHFGRVHANRNQGQHRAAELFAAVPGPRFGQSRRAGRHDRERRGEPPPPTPVTVELHSRAVLQRYAASQKNAVPRRRRCLGQRATRATSSCSTSALTRPKPNELGLEAVGGGLRGGFGSSVVPIHRAKGPEQLTIDLSIIAAITATNNGNGPEFETVEGDAFLRVVRAGVATAYPLVPAFHQGGLGGDYYMDLVTGPKAYAFDLLEGDAVYLYARYFVHDIGGAGTTIRYQVRHRGHDEAGLLFAVDGR